MARSTLRTIRLAATALAFALLWHLADGEDALRHLAAAHPAWVGAALLMLTLQTVLSALRWRLTARRLGIDLARSTAVREYYLGQLVNQLLPGGVLGDAGRAVRARDKAGLLASGQAVLLERLAGQLALFAVFAAGVVCTWLVSGGLDPPDWLAGVTLLLSAGAGLTLLIAPARACGQGRVRRALCGLHNAFAHAVAAPDVRTQQAALSLGTALCNIAAFACCAAAAGVSLAPAVALVIVPPVLLSMLIPLTVSGWGLREGAAAALLPLAGATSAGGLAASVAFGLTLLLATAPGLAVFALVAAPEPDNGRLHS